jgi:hypothetical protein
MRVTRIAKINHPFSSREKLMMGGRQDAGTSRKPSPGVSGYHPAVLPVPSSSCPIGVELLAVPEDRGLSRYLPEAEVAE